MLLSIGEDTRLFFKRCRSNRLWASQPPSGRPRCRAAHRASLRESRPLRASIADAYGPASSFGPARFACVRSAHRGGRCHVQPSPL